MMNAVENTLKHTHGAYGPAHMASRGSILDVTKTAGEALWAAAASRSVLRPTSSSKASAPAESSVSAPQAGPRSRCPARNTSTTHQPRRTLPDPGHLPEILIAARSWCFVLGSSLPREPPRTTNEEPPTKNHQRRTTNEEPPTKNHQRRTTNEEPPTKNHQRRTTNEEPPTKNHQRRTTNEEPTA